MDGLEVVIVDDGSQTPAQPALRPFGDLLDIRLLRQRRAGPAAAPNLGAEHARWRFLAFLDDDCVPARNWLQHLYEKLAINPDLMAGGPMLNAVHGNPYSAASQLVTDALFAYHNGDAADAGFLTSGNRCCPRTASGASAGSTPDLHPSPRHGPA